VRGTQPIAEYHVTVTTNELGLRGESLANDGGQGRLLAVGDSFTFGQGVDANAAWPGVLEAMLRAHSPMTEQVSVLNAGVPGYSLRQIRISAQELTDHLVPRLVIVGVYPSRYWRIADPYVLYRGVLIQQSRLQAASITPAGLIHPDDSSGMGSLDLWFKKHFYAGAYLVQVAHKVQARMTRRPLTLDTARQQLAPLVSELDRLQAFLNSQRVPLVVLLINEEHRSGTFTTAEHLYNDVLLMHCRDQHITCVDPLPALERTAPGQPLLRLGKDFHWSPLAHRIAAEELVTPVSTVLGLPRQRSDHLPAMH
jgi:hypothetical protein